MGSVNPIFLLPVFAVQSTSAKKFLPESLFKIVKLFSLCAASCCIFFVFLVFLCFFWGHKVHEELHKGHEEAVIQSLSN
jgi:hypothetical protein